MPFPNPDTQFKPGNPGGPGAPRGPRITTVLRALMDEKAADKGLATVWLKRALEGDFRYFKELLDRIEGKVPDKIENIGSPTVNDEMRARSQEMSIGARS